MMDPVDELVAIWLMLSINLVFLVVRIFLRLRRQRDSLHPSDYLVLAAFLVILAETILLTQMDADEIRLLRRNAHIPRAIDKAIIIFSRSRNRTNIKRVYIVIMFNTFALYTSKATLLTFLYEIFPRRLRKVLHVVSLLVALTFVANILESLLWCRPMSTMWAPSPTRYAEYGGYCPIKIMPVYSCLQFVGHLSSSLLVVLLPVVLLRWTRGAGRGDITFALSMLTFGAISIIASCVAFVCLDYLRSQSANPHARHATIISSHADQNALFLAACLSVLRVRRVPTKMTEEEEEGSELKGLVIKVERRFSLTVEFVEAWPAHWRDPWLGAKGSVMDMNDRESIPLS